MAFQGTRVFATGDLSKSGITRCWYASKQLITKDRSYCLILSLNLGYRASLLTRGIPAFCSCYRRIGGCDLIFNKDLFDEAKLGSRSSISARLTVDFPKSDKVPIQHLPPGAASLTRAQLADNIKAGTQWRSGWRGVNT